jgi:hypothetical protein
LQGGPRKESFFRNVALGRPAGAGEQNSGEARQGLAGERLGEGVGATRVRFGVLDRGGAAPVSGTPAAREGRPPRLPAPANWGSVGPVDRSASYGRG